jgi:hypothetical protein
METAALKNHPGMWMRSDAAAAVNALEDKYGVIVINSAGRSVADQQAEIDAYDAGDPNVYIPMRPPEASTHVQGIGLDVYNYTDDRAKLNEFGFEWFGPRDIVHYTYTSSAPSDAPTGDYNPFGILYSAGLQKIANLYGAGTDIDQKFGPKSMSGFAEFLRQKWGYVGNDELGPVMWTAIARWLRARWGYVGNDEPGPIMRAALQAAETANYNEL